MRRLGSKAKMKLNQLYVTWSWGGQDGDEQVGEKKTEDAKM